MICILCIAAAAFILYACGSTAPAAQSTAGQEKSQNTDETQVSQSTQEAQVTESTQETQAPESTKETQDSESIQETQGSESTQDTPASGSTQETPESENAEEEQSSGNSGTSSAPGDTAEDGGTGSVEDAPELPGMKCIGMLKPEYAQGYEAFHYEDGYTLIDVFDDSRYLLIPEDGTMPSDLPDDIICLKKPFDRIYMAATAVYSYFHALDAMQKITLTSSQKGGIYLPEVDEGLTDGTMKFAGKYSTPDYETLIGGECDLAIETTGIYHVPEIKEMIEELQIPVWVDRSSYESHPLGRVEWILLYGLLTDRVEEAERYFAEQKEKLETIISSSERTGKKVLIFYMSADGMPIIRQPDDYLVKMIELAGGEYTFAGYTLASDSVAARISMEEFYSVAKDTDIILYNASMENPLTSAEELIKMNGLFADFKAVQDGMVWTTDEYLFQKAADCCELAKDINLILKGEDGAGLQLLKKVE